MKIIILCLLMLSSLPLWAEEERKILYWVAPMDPNYRRDQPGKSPMGMDLIPVYADEQQDQGADVVISPQVVQNLGIRTAKVERRDLPRIIETVGYIDFDESKLSHIHLRVAGWIDQLSVRSEGERVKKGQRLFNLYSPELVNAQEEFVRAWQSGNRSLIRASRARLRALGINNSQITRLEKSQQVKLTIPIYAPQDGMVSELKAREGMYLKPADNALTLADLSSVWLIAEVFERQAEWVELGDQAEIRLPYLPGKVWQGQVEYIYPSLDAKTRTLKARLQFANPDEALKPNMYARVKLMASPKKNVLAIPIEALIRSGNQDRVILQVDEGQFNARTVVVGIESGDYIEIVRGLSEGETVVTSGQFLLDSEASLKASLQRMNPVEEKEETSQASDEPITAHGTVIEVNLEAHQLILEHAPIPALDWPGMEMMFPVDESVDLSALQAGDVIMFDLIKRGNAYPIIAIRKH